MDSYEESPEITEIIETDESDQEFSDGEVYLPGENDEVDQLEFDRKSYITYNEIDMGVSCLSFDLLGSFEMQEINFPLSVTFVAGTQAPNPKDNSIFISRITNLLSIENYDDDENLPIVQAVSFKHKGCINRLKSDHNSGSNLILSFSDNGSVNVWDISSHLALLDIGSKKKKSLKPVFTTSEHETEGYAIGWANNASQRFASGDNDGTIHVWNNDGAIQWKSVNKFTNLDCSVEDIQWSPNQEQIFSYCTSNGLVCISDIRSGGKPSISNKSHDSDVNVISWNRMEPLIASGGDDCLIKVWDLRSISQSSTPVAEFKHHTQPVNGIEWHPFEPGVLVVSGEDNQISLWDLSVDSDDPFNNMLQNHVSSLPPQLMFMHLGQKEIKEVHWHRSYPGLVLSTSYDGFNIFKTINI